MLILLLLAAAVLFVIGMMVAVLGERVQTRWAFIANLVLLALLFGAGYVMRAKPGVPAGNGNPALLLIFPLIGLGIVLIYQLYRYLQKRELPLRTLLLIGLALCVHQLFGFLIQHSRYLQLREQLESAHMSDGLSAYPYADVAMGIDSAYMNAHWFHLNVYALFLGWAAIIAIVMVLRLARHGYDMRSSHEL